MHNNIAKSQQIIFIITGPSGIGKTTLINDLLKNNNNLSTSISYTTRKKRFNEINGIHYNFIQTEYYFYLQNNNKLLESAKIYDDWYGTSISLINEIILSKKNIILALDWQGNKNLKEKFTENCVSIFLLPPKLQILKNRLINRAEDNIDIIEKRLKNLNKSLIQYKDYDYLIINDDYKQTLLVLQSIIISEKFKLIRQNKKHKKLILQLLK